MIEVKNLYKSFEDRSAEGRMQGKNAHKTPNREIAMNTRTNRSGSGHFLRPSGSKRP